MAGNDAPPGYATGETRETRGAAQPLVRFAGLGLALSVAALYELALRQPRAYLVLGSSPSAEAVQAISALGFGFGAWCAARARASWRGAWLGSCVLSLTLAASGSLWFWAFAERPLWGVIACGLPALGCGAAGFALLAGVRALGPALAALEALALCVHPLRAALTSLALFGYAIWSSRVGLWRASALLGAATALLAGHVPRLFAYLRAAPLARARAFELGAVALFALGLVAAGAAEAWLPGSELGRYPGELVYRTGSYAVVSVQQNLEVYVNGELHSASVDAERYAEALVHPALSSSASRRRVLVLGSADGFVERELLRYPDVESITSVTEDSGLARLVRHSRWFSARTEEALDSERVRVVQAEPIVWLLSHPQEFDAIVCDLPDPSDYRQAKNYTHYFYDLLRRRLAPGGVAVVQATSATATPRSFASITRTMRDAGLGIAPYTTAIPTLGEWAFVLGAAGAPPPRPAPGGAALRALRTTRYVDPTTLAWIGSSASALGSLVGEQNRLFDQPLVDILARERAEHGL